MAMKTDTLPDDPIALKKIILELQKQNDYLMEQFRLARQKRFGASSESSPDQEDLFNEVEQVADVATAADAAEAANIREAPQTTAAPARNKPVRAPLPKELPRETRIIDLPEAQKVCDCCQGPLHEMGKESREQLEFIPATLKVIETIRLKYSCRHWIGLKCFPEFRCKQAKLQINQKDYGTPFKGKQSYASQSAAFAVALNPETSTSNVVLSVDNKTFPFLVDEVNNYYRINLEDNSITKIVAPPQDHAANDLSDREEFISMLWQNRTGDRFAELVYNLSATSKDNQLVIISAIKETQNRKAFPLIDLWATSEDNGVAIASIALLKELELEESVPTLLNLMQSPQSQISCAAIEAFEHFYWKDEAVPERKGWAITPLIQRLTTQDSAVAACAIDALGKVNHSELFNRWYHFYDRITPPLL